MSSKVAYYIVCIRQFYICYVITKKLNLNDVVVGNNLITYNFLMYDFKCYILEVEVRPPQEQVPRIPVENDYFDAPDHGMSVLLYHWGWLYKP